MSQEREMPFLQHVYGGVWIKKVEGVGFWSIDSPIQQKPEDVEWQAIPEYLYQAITRFADEIEDKRKTCAHDYETPIRKGRADYRCRLCGADITLAMALIADANNTPDASDASAPSGVTLPDALAQADEEEHE